MEFDVEFHAQQGREHEAWLDVVAELKERGMEINQGEKDEELWAAIVKWGEELVELRNVDPVQEHHTRALEEARQQYPGGKANVI